MSVIRRGFTAPAGRVVWAIAIAITSTLALAARGPSSPSQNLTAAEVNTILRSVATALGDAGLTAAVVDRSGRILGVYARPGAAANSADVAVTVARAGAFFSNDAAPLSSRTVRSISGIHFPAGVPNTPSAALYGIDNTNRGCQLGPTDNPPFERPRSIAGSQVPNSPLLACRPDDTRGCARGGPIRMQDGSQNFQVGITTGKQDVLDPGQPLNVPVNPGGAPIFRSGRVVGGVGVAGVAPAQAEQAAFLASLSSAGLSPIPANPLPPPGAVFLDGIRLPFFANCISVNCVLSSLMQRPGAAGSFSPSDLLVAPRDGQAAPEGYLIGPTAGSGPNTLTADEVRRIIDQAVARANVTRAQIRLPLTQTTRMAIAVSDAAGQILAAFRMPDSTIFSFDVATAKARNAYYFSTREGYDVLKEFVTSNPYDQYSWEPDPPPGQGWAITNRTLGFAGQPLFPPGIDLEKPATPGPWFDLFTYDLQNPCTEGPGPSRGGDRTYPNQSGIVFFAGSAPLYKNGLLVGGVGVSGDGVEQDDYVTAGAVAGFEPPAGLRVDQSVIRTGNGDTVRLPYWKFPRNPQIR